MDDTGKAQNNVRTVLINQLEQMGMVRARGVKVDDHTAFQHKLVEHLGYMSERGLQVLSEIVLRHGLGKERNVWPRLVTIINLAEALERRPLTDMPNLVRWLTSIEGPRAMADGCLVETWQYFRKFKRPPIGWAATKMREGAAENRRQVLLFTERKERGVATRDELAWLGGYQDRLLHCQRLVENGQKEKAA